MVPSKKWIYFVKSFRIYHNNMVVENNCYLGHKYINQFLEFDVHKSERR